ncbi:MAG: glycosyltransferase family 4 protein [Anaerolineales bacterium]|nr:glycosyltransferase family 4 protein [Anaerolineales bacterium]
MSIKIGIDARLPFYQRGGISQYTLHLLPALAALDRENSYVVGHMGKDADSYVPDAPNFRRQDLLTPCHHRLERWALGVELALAQGRLTLWHSPDFIPPAFGVARRVITVHDLNFLHYPAYLTADSLRYYRGQIEWAVNTADHISADSEHTRQDLIHLLGVPPEKVTTVHLAVNPVYERVYTAVEINATLAQHNLPRGFILAVGTLEPRKNLPTLLQAYQLMRDEAQIDVPLVLVGRKGWLDEPIWAAVAELGLAEQVRHLEGVYDEALAHLYAAAGVLATPSHYEGFGLPALEAMTCGCPVVVSDRGSLPEIVGQGGAVLPADNVAAWANELTAVLTDSERRETMVAAGRRRASAFSWRDTAVATLKIYKQVAG